MNACKIAFVVLVTIIVVLCYILERKETKIEDLNSQNTILQSKVHEQNKIITELNDNFKLVQSLQSELVTKLNSNETKIQEFHIKLDKTMSKLERTLNSKPSLVQKKINDATLDVNKCFEELSKGLDCEWKR